MRYSVNKMDSEIGFLSAVEINKHRPDFNPRQMSSQYVAQVLYELEEKPVWYERDLLEKPTVHGGMCICRECRQAYWITPARDAYRRITSQKKTLEGPFCEECFNKISREIAKE